MTAVTTTDIVIEEQNGDIAACLALLDALEHSASRPKAVLAGWRLIRRLSRVMRDVRHIARTVPVEEIRRLHSERRSLYERYARIEGKLDPCSAWLLKKPFVHLKGICEDLALAADPEARELVGKIAAAVA